MDELVKNIKQVEHMIDSVTPLLVIDEWAKASERLPKVFDGLTEFLQLLMKHQNQLENINIRDITPILERLIFAMNIHDSIQIADILLYEMKNMFQNIYDQYGVA